MASITDYARMCKANDDCMECPMYDTPCSCSDYIVNSPAEASAIIDKWCEEHPKKTYLQDFLEKFPNAQVYDSGEPLASACNVYGNVFACEGHLCGECWNTVMPDEEEV